MPIIVKPEDLEPAEKSSLEKCCFCRKPTHYWHEKTDVACCQSCAETHNPEQLPTKQEWVDEEVWLELEKARTNGIFDRYVFKNGKTYLEMRIAGIRLEPYPYSKRAVNGKA